LLDLPPRRKVRTARSGDNEGKTTTRAQKHRTPNGEQVGEGSRTVEKNERGGKAWERKKAGLWVTGHEEREVARNADRNMESLSTTTTKKKRRRERSHHGGERLERSAKRKERAGTKNTHPEI